MNILIVLIMLSAAGLNWYMAAVRFCTALLCISTMQNYLAEGEIQDYSLPAFFIRSIPVKKNNEL